MKSLMWWIHNYELLIMNYGLICLFLCFLRFDLWSSDVTTRHSSKASLSTLLSLLHPFCVTLILTGVCPTFCDFCDFCATFITHWRQPFCVLLRSLRDKNIYALWISISPWCDEYQLVVIIKDCTMRARSQSKVLVITVKQQASPSHQATKTLSVISLISLGLINEQFVAD